MLRDPARGPARLLLALPDGDWIALGSDGSVGGRDRVGWLRRRAVADGLEEPALPSEDPLPPLPTGGLPRRTPDALPGTAHGCADGGAPAGLLTLLGALLGLGRRAFGRYTPRP